MKISLCLHTERTSVDTDYQQAYENFIQLCKQGDRGGFYTIWTGEHHAMDFAISPNPLLTVAALAPQIHNARLGTATIVAPFWHPIRLAGEIAFTNQVTHGRLEVGLSKGAFQYEYDRLTEGMTNLKAGEMLREHVVALRNLWHGNYAHDGDNWTFPSTSVTPQFSLKGQPPLWIAAQSPETVSFAIEHGCHVQMTPLWLGLEKVKESVSVFKHATQVAKSDAKLMLLQHAYIVESEEEKQQVLKHFSHYYREFYAWFSQANTVSHGRLLGELATPEGFSPADLENNLLIGTADEVLETLQYYQKLGVSEFALWLANGLSHEQNSRCLEAFVQHILPKFQKN
ncbi:flavin-dependent oxidoreductase [Vibrio sinensis]|uniref:Flavin-dependent oxidoreductase n=1 Tax=Vibrio sinensis TaxID=2302434 RepID=A0A3A6R3G1_9VIBR|nr:LLM class flavin-dependent oxidoreductase [Vibrio sinensis]RJX75677.1 flavin-dependent oxidoreductase [Vibrio sinensis]